MKPQQHTQSSPGQGDWDRERNRNEMDPRTGASSPEQGRPYQRSAPDVYPESHQQQQAQREHPGVEYFSGSTGYGGRGDYPQQGQGGYGQQGYGGGGWSRSEAEFRGQGGRQQEAFQSGARQQGFGGGEDFSRGGYGGYGREEQGHQFGGQFGSGQQQYSQGQHRETQHAQRGEFEERPFEGGSRQQNMGYGQSGAGQREFQSSQQSMGQYGGQQQGGHAQPEQFHGYGGQMSGQSSAGQSSRFGGQYQEHGQQGYGGYQSGQPQSQGAAQQSQFMTQSGYPSGGQPSGGYGSYGAYQVGSQPQNLGRSPRAPKDYTRSDERIRELICEHLAHHPSIDASEVSVNVQGGRVTLEGNVPERRMKHEIEDVADSCWGVKDVENHIRVGRSGQQSSLDNPAQGWLAAPADVMTGGASTEAATGKRTTSATDMSTMETSGSGMSASSETGSSGSTTIASGRKTSGTESKAKGK